MAKLQGPLHSDHAKGSVSGLTFREYRGLATVTRRPRSVFRVNPLQSNVRSILGQLSKSWGFLTEEQRQAWRDWAAVNPVPDGFGGTFQLDGNQAYIMLNHTAVRLADWDAMQELPPEAYCPATVDTLVAEDGVASGEVKLTWTTMGEPLVTDFHEIHHTKGFQSPGRVAVENHYRSQGLHPSGTTYTLTVTGLELNLWYWFRVRYVDAYGQRSNWLRVQWQSPTIP